MENIVTTGAVISYAMGVLDPKLGSHNTLMLLTLPFVLYGIFAISYSVTQRKLSEEDTRLEQGGTSERPEEVINRFANFNHRSGLIITSFEFYYLKIRE